MKVGIHQPYLFPYLGYFQLIAAVDRFVIYDDVNFIKGGWINRNSILGPQGPLLITLELLGASPNKRINQIGIGGNAARLVKTIDQAYRKAPRHDAIMPEIEACLLHPEKNLAAFIGHSLRRMCRVLGIQTRILVSSELALGLEVHGQERVLAICKGLGATTYINAIGGRSLYDGPAFAARDIELRFLSMAAVRYSQARDGFSPNLSIIDVLMHNPPEALPTLLSARSLIRHDDP